MFDNRIEKHEMLQDSVQHICARARQPFGHAVWRPTYHITPFRNWLNDPVGLILYQGVWHLFYQHAPNSKVWEFGIVWGHAVSYDLVHWKRLPPALIPTEDHADAAGCFSGCCTVDVNGVPTILYTGVRLRENLSTEELPPISHDLQLPFIECQLAAFGDPADPELRHWRKAESPVLALPPSSNLTGFRDPFVFQRGGSGREWITLVGSGIQGEGGAVLVYRSSDLTSGWRCDGFLCKGDGTTGAMWECPLLVDLSPRLVRRPPMLSTVMRRSESMGSQLFSLSDKHDYHNEFGMKSHGRKRTASMDCLDIEVKKYLLCISPDAPENPVICWLGSYTNGRFDIDDAEGPFRLDLGDVLYAPNVTRDNEGRWLLWGWLQEKDPPEYLDHAGCMSLPRVLSFQDGHLFQEPAPEIEKLRRQDRLYHAIELDLFEQPTPLLGVGGPAINIEVAIERRTSDAVGILLKPWGTDGDGTAAIVYEWESSLLKVIVDSKCSAYTVGSRETGGIIRRAHGAPLELQIFLDYSSLEIFTQDGQVLSTKVYRGPTMHNFNDAGIDFVAFGGFARMTRVTAYEMSSIWEAGDAESAKPEAEVVGAEWAMKEAREGVMDCVCTEKAGSEISDEIAEVSEDGDDSVQEEAAVEVVGEEDSVPETADASAESSEKLSLVSILEFGRTWGLSVFKFLESTVSWLVHEVSLLQGEEIWEAMAGSREVR